MFSSAQRLVERTGQSGTPRRQYLQELVTEFQTTNDAGRPAGARVPTATRRRGDSTDRHEPVPRRRGPATGYVAARLQVLCHLANFAYDPINYQHLRDLRVISLFLGAGGRAGGVLVAAR